MNSTWSKVVCLIAGWAVMGCLAPLAFAQRGGGGFHGGGGGGFHGGGGGFHAGGSGFAGGGAHFGYTGGGHGYTGGSRTGGYYGTHGSYGWRGGYPWHGGGYGWRGGYGWHGYGWGGRYGWGYPGYGWGWGLGFGWSYWGWGWGYPYGSYGYSVPYYYAYPDTCPPGYTCTPNGDDPPPQDPGPNPDSNPAPWRPTRNAPNLNYGADPETTVDARPPVRSVDHLTATPADYKVPQTRAKLKLRPEVVRAAEVLHEMPPFAREREIESGWYSHFSPKEREFLKTVK